MTTPEPTGKAQYPLVARVSPADVASTISQAEWHAWRARLMASRTTATSRHLNPHRNAATEYNKAAALYEQAGMQDYADTHRQKALTHTNRYEELLNSGDHA